jgi:hypothetical protein
MADKVQSAFLILSDLHFGTDFLREAEIDPLQFPWFLKYIAPKVKNFFEAKCGAHDIAILTQLPLYCKSILRDLGEEGLSDRRFDLVLLLGDLATYANGGSYVFLREYIAQERFKDSSGTTRKGIRAIHQGDIIAIPGNHDKLLRRNLDLYHSKFSVPLSLVSEPKSQSSFFTSRIINQQEFIFALIEASNYADEDGKLDFGALAHLASGRIPRKLRQEIKNKFKLLSERQTVDQACVADFGSARKILLVHYAVDERVVFGPAPKAQEFVVSHRCDGLDTLIEELSESVHLVVHGHLHHPKIYNHCGVPVAAATTLSQRHGENGFFVVKFMTSGDIVLDHHKWNENGFVRDESEELRVRIARSAGSASPLATGATGG